MLSQVYFLTLLTEGNVFIIILTFWADFLSCILFITTIFMAKNVSLEEF